MVFACLGIALTWPYEEAAYLCSSSMKVLWSCFNGKMYHKRLMILFSLSYVHRDALSAITIYYCYRCHYYDLF